MTPHRAHLILAALPAAAPAQELMQVTYSWQEVIGLTTTPVTNPNSVLDPGEGARIGLNLEALINGTNAVGQNLPYNPPIAVGTVRGLGSFMYNLTGDSSAATAAGSWGARSISTILQTGAFTGNVTNNGATRDSFGGQQFIPPGGTANPTNPITNAFRGVWKPTSYTPRSVHFLAAPGSAAPAGQQNSILVEYIILSPEPQDIIQYQYINSNFGSGISIPIVPAPASALGLGVMALWPRRRGRS